MDQEKAKSGRHTQTNNRSVDAPSENWNSKCECTSEVLHGEIVDISSDRCVTPMSDIDALMKGMELTEVKSEDITRLYAVGPMSSDSDENAAMIEDTHSEGDSADQKERTFWETCGKLGIEKSQVRILDDEKIKSWLSTSSVDSFFSTQDSFEQCHALGEARSEFESTVAVVMTESPTGDHVPLHARPAISRTDKPDPLASHQRLSSLLGPEMVTLEDYRTESRKLFNQAHPTGFYEGGKSGTAAEDATEAVRRVTTTCRSTQIAQNQDQFNSEGNDLRPAPVNWERGLPRDDGFDSTLKGRAEHSTRPPSKTVLHKIDRGCSSNEDPFTQREKSAKVFEALEQSLGERFLCGLRGSCIKNVETFEMLKIEISQTSEDVSSVRIGGMGSDSSDASRVPANEEKAVAQSHAAKEIGDILSELVSAICSKNTEIHETEIRDRALDESVCVEHNDVPPEILAQKKISYEKLIGFPTETGFHYENLEKSSHIQAKCHQNESVLSEDEPPQYIEEIDSSFIGGSSIIQEFKLQPDEINHISENHTLESETKKENTVQQSDNDSNTEKYSEIFSDFHSSSDAKGNDFLRPIYRLLEGSKDPELCSDNANTESAHSPVKEEALDLETKKADLNVPLTEKYPEFIPDYYGSLFAKDNDFLPQNYRLLTAPQDMELISDDVSAEPTDSAVKEEIKSILRSSPYTKKRVTFSDQFGAKNKDLSMEPVSMSFDDVKLQTALEIQTSSMGYLSEVYSLQEEQNTVLKPGPKASHKPNRNVSSEARELFEVDLTDPESGPDRETSGAQSGPQGNEGSKHEAAASPEKGTVSGGPEQKPSAKQPSRFSKMLKTLKKKLGKH